jgi:purine-binding chemotaxis protein CheW
MKTLTRQPHVLDQQLALSAYLDALLEEPVQQARPAVQEAATQVPACASAGPAQVGDANAAADVSPGRAGRHTETDKVVPEWAGARFQALMFEVDGLTLAVPLVKLKGVVDHAGDLTLVPGQAAPIAGLAEYQGQQTRVVDTAQIVLPADRAARLDSEVTARCRHLVVIDEGRWALACSGIGDVIELDSSDVKWRAATGRRLWLAGTVIERMCALLDIDQLTCELQTGSA